MKTKSKEIVDEILEKIKAYNKLVENIEEKLRIEVMNGAPYDPAIDIKKDYEELEIKSFVNEKIKELQKASLKESYYFFDCSFKVYKSHFHKRKIKFIASNIDVDEADFIKEELSSRINKKKGRRLKPLLTDISYHYFIYYNISFTKPEEKKNEFLEKKLELLGWDTYLIDDEDGEPSHYYFEKNSFYSSILEETEEIKFKTCKGLNDFICSKILEINELKDTVGEDIRERLDHGEEDYSILYAEQEVFENEIKSRTKLIEKKIEELYYKSLEDNFYFFNCPLKVYKNTVDKRYSEYQNKFVDDDADDFLDDELYKLQNPEYHTKLFYNGKNINYHKYTFQSVKVYNSSSSKKRIFIEDALKRRNDLISRLETNSGTKEKEIIKTPVVQQTESIKNDLNNLDHDESLNYPKDIFNSQRYYQYYLECLKYHNAITNDSKIKRGFSAIAHAIFKNKDFQDHIFKTNIPLKDYITFLTKDFDFNKTSRLSDHTNHISSISKYTSSFDIKDLTNKKE
jgi:hypothetical protein